MVDARDHYSGQHSMAVALLAQNLAQTLGLDRAETLLIALGGRLHDVGKVAVPDDVLQKPGRLSANEWEMVRQHPSVGADIVGRVPSLRAIAPLIRGHHERWDGTGYPDHLAGEQIPLGARILGVAEAFCAMTSDQVYRQAMDVERARSEIQRRAGTQFDPAVAEAMGKIILFGILPAPELEAS
jgi:putative nucleotidyltransferase with HDIG domain